jgi:chemotaxis protein MotB
MRSSTLVIAGRFTIVGVVALLASACYKGRFEECTRRGQELQGQLDQANTRNQELDEQVQALTADNGTLSDRLRALGEDVSELRAREGQLSTDLEAAQRRAEELARRERAAADRLNTMRSMLGRFRDMIASGRLRVRIVRGRMVIEMSSNILFDSGSADLSTQGEETLAEVAAVLRDIPNREFQVAGHTDNVPIRLSRFRDNWHLSTSRALEVVQYLQEQGVDPRHLSATGYSEFAPATSNDSEDGRAANRRIEIVLMPNLDELPDLSSLEQEIGSTP